MKLGFIRPDFNNEKRVALLPGDINGFENELFIEDQFGEFLDVPNAAYEQVGCTVKSRDAIYEECDAIFSLKLIQPSDYHRLPRKQSLQDRLFG